MLTGPGFHMEYWGLGLESPSASGPQFPHLSKVAVRNMVVEPWLSEPQLHKRMNLDSALS